MREQDYIIASAREAMGEAFRYAKAVPEDKINWKPLDAGRSVLELARELAKCSDWAYGIVSGTEMSMEESQAEMNSWATIAQCEAAGQEKLARFLDFVDTFPSEKLAETIELPFGPGGSMKTFAMSETMDYPRWNASYHQGQIAYIQTLYGDNQLY
jgi:hypothetical protein